MRNKILLFLLTFIGISQIAAASSVRDKYNFNSEWLLYVGDIPEAKEVRFQDTDWKKVTLPRPFNEDEAFRLSIEQLTDTVMWYRNRTTPPAGVLPPISPLRPLSARSRTPLSTCSKTTRSTGRACPAA